MSASRASNRNAAHPERIHELYGVGFPNSFILMLARWVYFGNVFDDALPEDSAEMQQLVADLTEAVRRMRPTVLRWQVICC